MSNLKVFIHFLLDIMCLKMLISGSQFIITRRLSMNAAWIVEGSLLKCENHLTNLQDFHCRRHLHLVRS